MMNIEALLAELDSSQSVFLSSKGQVLKTCGKLQPITIDKSSDSKDEQIWLNQIDKVLKKLNDEGAPNPVVVGAIGFDGRSQPQLYSAEDYEIISAKLFTQSGALENIEVENISQVTSKEKYTASVKSALDLFQYTPLKKVVLSRSIDIKTQTQVKASQFFQSLLTQNPNAYVFSVPLLDDETLLGASPELLIQRKGQNIVSNPLAGSAKRTECEKSNYQLSESLLSSSKDLYEHRFVVDAVSETLNNFCDDLHTPEIPSVIATPTMFHLSTEISGQLTLENNLSSLHLAYALHPTPAICGTPYQLAHQAITLLENYTREMFSGMVGWVDNEGNGEWAVTIRCGKVSKDNMRLYAGAGIVESSEPEAEWQETSAKLGTMLNAFGLNLNPALLAEGLA